MEQLVVLLNSASDAYYNGKEVMSNKEFDALLSELEALEAQEGRVLPNSPTHKVGAPVTGELPKFKHTHPALSLDKTKDINLFVHKFHEGITNSMSDNNDVVLMYKEDGGTVQAYYVNGILDKLVTRGNGEIGSVVTHNINCLSGLPIKLSHPLSLVVRGEAVMSYNEFNEINSQLDADVQYANPRNLATATLTMLDSDEAMKRHLMFQGFNFVDGDVPEWADDANHSFSGRLKFLESLGFNVVPYKKCNISELEDTVAEFTDNVSNYEYPVDGLVAAMDNYAYSSKLEGTEHHPHIMNGYAFKWADETKETTLREIEWSPSRTGLLNPVAVFDPIELDGTVVKRASLHNLSIMRKMRIHVGDKLAVYKSNMIIPFVDENLSYNDEYDYTDEFVNEMIGYCPTCKAKARVNRSVDGIETAYCPNQDCPEKMIGKLAHFCERDCMDIQGMSEETIKKLVEAGFIREYADFFYLADKPGVSFLPGFGKQSWKKMCDAAEKARKTTFVRFITALGITNIGKGQAKTLYKYVSTHYDELVDKYHKGYGEYKPAQIFRLMTLQNFDFSKIDGFGETTSNEIKKWAHKHWEFDTPETHVMIILDFIDERPSIESTSSNISGKSFCITGKLIHHSNRQELVAKIESFGGKWVDSVSSKTDYLINNDVTSTSGKNKKAQSLNIPIISEEDFLKLIGE